MAPPVTTLETTPPSPSSAPAAGSTPSPGSDPAPGSSWLRSRAWVRPALLLAGTVVAGDGLSQVLHLHGGGLLGLGVLAGGLWWLRRPRALAVPRLPESVAGWIERCERLLESFERLEGEPTPARLQRQGQLAALREAAPSPSLRLALVGAAPPATELQPSFLAALRCRHPLHLEWGSALPAASSPWRWPQRFQLSDLVLFHLRLPLTAADLRWLEALPAGQPVWLLVEAGSAPSCATTDDAGREQLVAELLSQWPGADPARLLSWNGQSEHLSTCLQPLVVWLGREGRSLRASTPLRCFEALHQQWQAELEQLRRREWLHLQQRTQWIVAGAVFASPLPSLDLLVLAAANGLMLQEMARLWDCPWQVDQLRSAALELGRAALALGVVEWSSQALLAAMRLDAAGWLVGGALQAFSAAYLTRVVGRAMADVLALSVGVSAPDLEEIKRQAPLLVARAAEAERLDWAAFLRQGRAWLQQQGPLALPGSLA